MDYQQEQGFWEPVDRNDDTFVANEDSFVANSYAGDSQEPSGWTDDTMNEDLALPNGDAHIPTHPCKMDIPTDWKSGVTSFCCEKSVVNAINWFQRTNHCCLGYARTVKPNPEKKVKGRLNFACIHGISHCRKNIHLIPKIRETQRVNYVRCEMKICINQQKDGEWLLRSFDLEHINAAGEPAHLTGLDVYNSSRQAKAMVDKEALDLLKEFTAVKAPTTCIADRLSQKFGVNHTRQDVANRINNKLGSLMSESDLLNVNTILEEIIDGGGDVFAKYHEGTNKCRVLIIMTKYQKIDLNLSRPKVFVNDTTFGTNSENFKVNVVKLLVLLFKFLDLKLEIKLFAGLWNFE